MTIRTFWLNLGWLVMLVVTFAVPLALDSGGRLTYFTSLALWGIPILYLWPTFMMITEGGTGRRRRALRLAAGLIVGLGVVLDFLIGYLTLRFRGAACLRMPARISGACRPWAAGFQLRNCCSTRWDPLPSCWFTRARMSCG